MSPQCHTFDFLPDLVVENLPWPNYFPEFLSSFSAGFPSFKSYLSLLAIRYSWRGDASTQYKETGDASAQCTETGDASTQCTGSGDASAQCTKTGNASAQCTEIIPVLPCLPFPSVWASLLSLLSKAYLLSNILLVTFSPKFSKFNTCSHHFASSAFW